MQAFQDQKEVNEERFNEIDKRWARVEEAIRVEEKERTEDSSILHHQFKEHNQVASTL